MGGEFWASIALPRVEMRLNWRPKPTRAGVGESQVSRDIFLHKTELAVTMVGNEEPGRRREGESGLGRSTTTRRAKFDGSAIFLLIRSVTL